MKPVTNVFGQKVCLREDCPAYFMFDGEPGCDARLMYVGRLPEEYDEKFGNMCGLPVEFKIVRCEDEE